MTTATTATKAGTEVAYHTTVREMPTDERPRERLERYGASTLQTAELLAIILRVGTAKENVIELSSRLLRQYNGLGGLLAVDFAELCAVHGVGQAKASQLKAALELGRRLSVLAPRERPQITRPNDATELVMLEMGYLTQEQLRILCLDTKNYVVRDLILSGRVAPRSSSSSATAASTTSGPACAQACR